MPANELAQLLVRKATHDEFAVRTLMAHPEAPDEMIGFHAQQAIEKLFKAVLANRGIPYRKTHNLLELIDLLLDNDIPFPPELEEARILTPFAVEFRYDELLPDPGSAFDQATALRLVELTRIWVLSLLSAEDNQSKM